MAVAASGCASFEGMPKPVLTDTTVDAMIAKFRPDEVVAKMDGFAAEDMKSRNTYRDRVVMAYLTAIDARYDNFRRELSSTGKGGHVAADTATLVLTGIASISTGGAQELAAAATVVGGARSSFDKEVLADKTLPLLVSLMDSQRLTVRADIMRGLSQDEGAYTIQEAFSDLMRYQSAGSIDAAVQAAAASAAQRAEAVQYDYGKAIELCTTDAPTAQARTKLMNELQAIAKLVDDPDPNKASAARQHLQDAAKAVDGAVPAPAANSQEGLKQLVPVRDLVQTFCDTTSVNGFAAKLKAAGVPVT